MCAAAASGGTSAGSGQQHKRQRQRVFPHAEGQWATHVRVPVSAEDTGLAELREAAIAELASSLPPECAPTATETLHISLTRSTTVLRVHELAPVLEQLQSRMTAHTPFSVDLSGGLHYFENEDSSRCFLGMLVGRGRHHLHSVVDEVDAVLAPYGQPPFYDERQYHVSLAWWLPDPQREGIGPDSLPTGLMDRLAALEQRLRADFVLDTDLHVERLVFATGSGFKRHSIPLRRR